MSQKWSEFSRKSAGPTVNAESAPYSALIMTNDSPNICTGTLVSFTVVITVARCFYTGTGRLADTDETVEVYAGTNSISSLEGPNIQKGEVMDVRIHPNFRPSADKMHFGYNDLALLSIVPAFRESLFVRPISIGYLDWTRNIEGLECLLAMFSSVNPLSISPQDDLLRLTTVTVSHQCECAEKLDIHFGQRTARWICPVSGQSGRGPCLGSAGAGLVCQDRLVALLVGMIPFDSLEQCVFLHNKNVTCRNYNTLPVFMDLCPFLRWVRLELRDPSLPLGPDKCSRALTTHSFSNVGLFLLLLNLIIFKYQTPF